MNKNLVVPEYPNEFAVKPGRSCVVLFVILME